MATLYFRHTKTKKRYEVIGRDKEKGTITLRGEFGTFTEKFDKVKFVEMGYVMEVEE